MINNIPKMINNKIGNKIYEYNCIFNLSIIF